MSQFSLVLIGRHENRDEPVAQALSAAFGQGIDWGRAVVASAPIVLLEALGETQGQAIHAGLRNVEAAGCRFSVFPTGSADVDGCSKLRWPTPPAINGYPLESYVQPGAGPATASATISMPTAQINCPHCGVAFRISLNILSGTSPRASARQLSPSMGTPTPNSAPSLSSSGSYAPQPQAPAPVPVGYGAQGVGTSSGFYQLPGSNAMINPGIPQGQTQPYVSGPATPPQPQNPATPGGVGGSGTINLPAAQALPKARSVTPNPAQPPQPGLAPRPATPDRGQHRPSPQGGQRQISPSMGQPTGGRPQSTTPGTGTVPPRKPNSGHYGKPDGFGPLTASQPVSSTGLGGSRSSIDLPPAQALPTGNKPASNTAIPTLPPGADAPTHSGGTAKPLPALDSTGGSEYSDLQGPMSLDEFEAHISGIHAPIEPPPNTPGGKKPPPPPQRGSTRRPDRRR